MTVATVRALSFIEALAVVKGESKGAEREAANTLIAEAVKSSVEHVALRWHNRGTLRRWFDLDDLCQELRLVLFTRATPSFRVPEGKPDAEVTRIFGRYAIVILDNYLRDTYRHSKRNWTMHAGSIDHEERRGAAEIVEDQRDYTNAPGGLDEREMLGAVRSALSGEHSQIAYLLFEGKSWKEIGAILGENPGTLRDRLRRRAAPVLRTLLNRWAS